MKHWNLSAKIIVAFSALITITAGILTAGVYWQLQTSLHQGMADRLLEIVQLAAPQIDSGYHSLVVSPQDAKTVYYQINKKAIKTIQAASKDIQHIYTVRQNSDGQYSYILDYRPDKNIPLAIVGSPIKILPPLLQKGVSIEQPTVETFIINNSSGIPVLYGYAPILSQFNRLDGLVVVELDARPILEREFKTQIIGLITFVGILVVTLAIVWYLAQSLVVRPILKLNQVSQNLAQGKWDKTLSIERTDELGALARSFNYMAEQLKISFKELQDYSQNLEKKVEERTRKLSESQQLLDLIMNNIPQSIFWKNRDSVFLGCNQSFAKVFGINPEEIVGKNDYEMPWKKEESDFFVECDRRIMDNDMPELGIVEPQLQPDGRQHWLETSKVPFHDIQGNVIGIIGIFQDITKYKEAEKAAQQASQAKSDFLANMSHELRTPLNGILGYAQILGRSKTLADKERNGIEIIYQCGSHLLTLINDILDLSKIEAGKLDLTPTALHLPSLLQSVVEMCKIRAEQKAIEFIYHPSSRLPEGIEADEKRLRQVLINLLGNAIKFTDRGSVTLRVDVLKLSHNRVSLLFQVIDTGIGIAEKDLEKLFQSFEQVGTRQSEGTGLGLAISQRIIQIMGGKIKVKSQLAKGSEFFFTVELPLAEDWVEQQQTIKENNSIIGYKGKLRKILIVDDRWENRAVVLNLLETLNFTILEAENGEEGLEKLRKEQPDLVITDIAMPVMNGLEFLKQIRNTEELKYTKVIVSSASVAQQDRQMAFLCGGDDFLAKPVHAKLLFQLLSNHLELEWLYEAGEDELKLSEPLSTKVILPPNTTVEALLDSARNANLKALRSQIEQLVDGDGVYAAFAEPILQLAKQFKAEEIEELLEQYIKEPTHAR